MIKKLLIFLLWISICPHLNAQTGSYFLTNYSPPDKQLDYRSKAMVQDSQGEIYFATKAGLLEFDGLKWQLIRVPAAVYTISAQNTHVLVGGLRGAGKLSDKLKSPRAYEPFSDAPGIISSVTDLTHGYLCSAEEILIYSLEKNTTEVSVKANLATGKFMGVYRLGEDIAVRTDIGRILKLKNNQLTSLDFPINNLLFSKASTDANADLIGTDDNRVFILRNGMLTEVALRQDKYLAHHILVDGVWVSPDLIALGTIRGGVIFVNTVTGATEQIINYESGIPDNEVFSLMTDRHHAVWVAHEYGFTRIAPQLPFVSFNHYTGLEGNLLCVQTYQEKLYVGTSLGLYVLTQSPTPGRKPQEGNTISFGNAGEFSYKKIDRIEGKVTQLTEINGKLFASGSGGVFEINNQEVRTLSESPVHFLFYSQELKQVLVASTEEGVNTYSLFRQGWEETHLLDSINSYITHIFEDNLNNIWLCGGMDIYKVELVDEAVTDIMKFDIQNPTLDETVGFGLGTDTYVVSSGQFKKFNGAGFVNYDSLSGGGKYFFSSGNFWFNDGAKWRSVNRKFNSIKLEWLGVFSGLRFISWDTNHQALWVITDENELYKFVNEKAVATERIYPLFLRAIKGDEVKLKEGLEIEQTEGSVSFEFAQPDYVGARATQYRYQVMGLNKEWTPWSTGNNVINFSYLPAGSYTLAVQSKDLLGVESAVEQIQFKVLPPYWKRWWFYALEFVVFSFLVAGSIRLARADSRYRYLSEILTILTVIMLIQFIQTVITSMIRIDTSPVLEFFVQVCIALLVFPIEIIARKGLRKVSRNTNTVQRIFNNSTD